MASSSANPSQPWTPTDLELRIATNADQGAVEALFDSCFPPNSTTLFGRHDTEVADGIADESILVVALDGELIGFIQWGDVDSGQVHIEGMGVERRFRGHGIAGMMLEEALTVLGRPDRPLLQFSMTVSPSNTSMIRCALAHGFRGAELYRNYFGVGADRLYLRTQLPRSILMGTAVTYVPIESDELTESLIGAQTHVLTGFTQLPQGPCWVLHAAEHIDVSGPLSNESASSIGVAAVLIGAFSFLFGLGLVDDGYPGDLLIVVGLGFLSSVGAMLVYGKTTAQVSRIRDGKLDSQMAAGNILSEIGGYYSLFHVVPVAFAQSTNSRWLGLVLAAIAAVGLMLYHRSDFEMLQRYKMAPSTLFAIEALLAVSPILGVTSLLIWDNTTWWSFADVLLLISVMGFMGTRRKHSAHS